MERYAGIPLNRIAKVPPPGADTGKFYEEVSKTEHPMTKCIERLKKGEPEIDDPAAICHERLKEEGVKFPRPRKKKK